MKRLLKFFCTLLILLATGGILTAQDFTVKSSTDKTSQLCTPVRTGSTTKVQVKVTSNRSDTCTVSIDKSYSFGAYASWVSIDNSGQSILKTQTITFNLDITPANANDGDLYPFQLTFIVRNKKGNSINPSYSENVLFSVRIDNSIPSKPVASVSYIHSNSATINWTSSTDDWSNPYTASNISAGVNGIKSYTVVLKNSAGTTMPGAGPLDASTYYYTGNYYPYSGLTSSTTYTATVTAADFAGNTNTSSVISFTTPLPPPDAPTSLASSSISYCSTTLTWVASPTATIYNVYNSTTTPSSKIGTTTTTSFNVTGLSAGTTNKFYVTAESNTGVSPQSTTFSVTTLSIPTPTISGPATVCSLGATFTVGNLPSGCSVSWDPGTNLSLSSASGSSATFTPTGNSSSWVRATFNSGCGTAYRNYSIVAGSPVPGAISIDFDAPPRRFTATIDGVNTATSYKWYLDGVLKSSTSSTSVIFQRQLNNCGHVYYVDVAEVNACGVSEISHAEVSEDPCYYGFSISPNPASENVTLTIGKAENTATTQSTQDAATFRSKFISTNSYTVRIFDNFGTIKATLKKSGETVTLPISNLDNGCYIIEINDGNKIYRQQLVVKH
ncbi:MAG: T9SS type A sorting domain-containing protein [Bacteroidales bacterium]|nr:T9SS type A sorting domain-containing protein [Bacteroidales bacterium]